MAIARALATKPMIVLADEPTANLDSKTGKSIIELMKKLNQELETTFIFSTHDPEIVEIADHVIRLQDGLVIEDMRRNGAAAGRNGGEGGQVVMSVVAKIAFRNIRRHKTKTLIIGILITIGITVLVVGNSLMDTASRGIERTYIESYTGHVVITGRHDGGLRSWGSRPPTPSTCPCRRSPPSTRCTST